MCTTSSLKHFWLFPFYVFQHMKNYDIILWYSPFVSCLSVFNHFGDGNTTQRINASRFFMLWAAVMLRPATAKLPHLKSVISWNDLLGTHYKFILNSESIIKKIKICKNITHVAAILFSVQRGKLSLYMVGLNLKNKTERAFTDRNISEDDIT